jgi:patatin-like phospholipase/acyl hydrolase
MAKRQHGSADSVASEGQTAGSKQFRILSLDGGGIRGLITAIWLKRLEQEVKKPLHECFDLVAGTSTGAILACGISMGVPVDRIIQLYMEQGREVFPAPASRLWGRFTRVLSEGFSAPKYDGTGLERLTKRVYLRK